MPSSSSSSVSASGPPVRESWDTPIALAACIFGCCAGMGAYFGLPLLLDAAGTALAIDTSQLGWIAAAESFGMLFGSLIASRLVASNRLRAMALSGAALAAVPTLLVVHATELPVFCSLRLLAGIGNGLLYSASAACLGRSSNAPRNFTLLAIIVVPVNSLELWVLPSVRTEWGLSGMYTLLAAAFIVPALLYATVPKQVPQAPADQGISSGPGERVQPAASVSLPRSAWLCLTGILVFATSVSSFWAYAERIGMGAGLSEHAITQTLTVTNLLSLLGSAIAYPLIGRYGPVRTLIVCAAVLAGVFAWWSVDINPTTYVIGVFLVLQVWSAMGVSQFAAMAAMDPVGRGVALVSGALGIGTSSGPLLAGLILSAGAKFSALHMATGMIAALSAAIFILVLNSPGGADSRMTGLQNPVGE